MVTDHLRRCLGGGEGAKGCLEIRHEQGNGDSFSSDVAPANAKPIFVQLNHIEVVATDFIYSSGDLNSGKLGQSAGQQRLLNLARPLEFFLFLLLLLQRFFQLSLDQRTLTD